MLTPEYLSQISEGAEEIAEMLHQDILNRIIERIMIRSERGDNYRLTSYDKWQLETLQDAGFLLEDIQKEIAEKTPLMQREIASAMEDAGVETISYDMKIYQDAGILPAGMDSYPLPTNQSPHLIRLMQRTYEATLGEWGNVTRTTANAAHQTFIQACDKAYYLVTAGGMSSRQATREAINEIASNGVVITYPSGHTDTIETATTRAVRTGIAQSSAQIQLARMEEMNHDLVLISSHMGARPEHAEWQGKVFSRTGKTTEYPDFVTSTGYGTVTGFAGANCTHSLTAYIEGMPNPFEEYDSEENRKAYEVRQRQRTLERRIRHTKRDVMARQTALDSCEDPELRNMLERDYQRKSALLQKQNKNYNEYCQQNNLKKRDDRIAIAQWDRKQAAAARGAAQRWKNRKG